MESPNAMCENIAPDINTFANRLAVKGQTYAKDHDAGTIA
jgi:hypothetical protein